jgi:2-methylcitrate dehydratase
MTAALTTTSARHYAATDFISVTLAEWAIGLTYEDLSPRSIDLAKLFWLDSLGCAIGGSQTQDARILHEHYSDLGSISDDAPCTLLVGGSGSNPVEAAFLNAHLIRAMDFNDIYWKADPAHPSDIIAGPLALSEMLGMSGRDLILATVIAYELQCRFAEVGVPGIREYGWHHATLSGFSSAFACAKVLGLNADQMVNAVGISASRTGTFGAVTAGDLTMMKNMVDPWACRVGVESALLAQRGFSGPRHIIDGKEGLFHTLGHNALAGSPCVFDAGMLTHSLPNCPDDQYRIESTGMKAVPVEALMHTPLTALHELISTNPTHSDQIERITVEVIARAADILGDPAKYRPRTRETADHSLPYAVAVMIEDGELGHAQFAEARVQDPRLIPLMDTIEVIANSDFDACFPESQPARVTIHLRDGTVRSARADYPKGAAENPMSPAEVFAKVVTLAEPIIGSAQCQELYDTTTNLNLLSDVRPMIRATLPV